MFKVTIVTFALTFLAGCGTSLDTGKKFREEKDQRIDTQKDLFATQERLRETKELLSNVTSTKSFLWAWRSNSYGISFDEARLVCQDVGYDLPTEDMLVEADKDDRIKPAISIEGVGRDVFVLDNPRKLSFTILCVKPGIQKS